MPRAPIGLAIAVFLGILAAALPVFGDYSNTTTSSAPAGTAQRIASQRDSG
jgi:hypothetical protein